MRLEELGRKRQDHPNRFCPSCYLQGRVVWLVDDECPRCYYPSTRSVLPDDVDFDVTPAPLLPDQMYPLENAVPGWHTLGEGEHMSSDQWVASHGGWQTSQPEAPS